MGKLKRTFRKPRRRGEDMLKWILKREREYSVDWIYLDEYGGKWRVVVSKVINILVL
jgi:hypothetical protein